MNTAPDVVESSECCSVFSVKFRLQLLIFVERATEVDILFDIFEADGGVVMRDVDDASVGKSITHSFGFVTV
uniref:Uncharacterized protein n=1 Tax=Caenorhabditis japonica TaxID=281687 RepID=A0A8R1EMJ5_CAEJA